MDLNNLRMTFLAQNVHF